MSLDLNKLATNVLRAHIEHRPMRLPAMSVRQLGVLARLLQQLEQPVNNLSH